MQLWLNYGGGDDDDDIKHSCTVTATEEKLTVLLTAETRAPILTDVVIDQISQCPLPYYPYKFIFCTIF